jgi:hypothetical protein
MKPVGEVMGRACQCDIQPRVERNRAV